MHYKLLNFKVQNEYRNYVIYIIFKKLYSNEYYNLSFLKNIAYIKNYSYKQFKCLLDCLEEESTTCQKDMC